MTNWRGNETAWEVWCEWMNCWGYAFNTTDEDYLVDIGDAILLEFTAFLPAVYRLVDANTGEVK